MRRLLFKHDRRGTIAVMAATSLTALIGATALSVDFGLFQATRAKLQAANDAASLAAALDIGNAATRAATMMTANGFAPSSIQNLKTGTYCPDPATPVANRFTPGVAGCAVATGPLPNAVQLTGAADAMFAFGRALAPRTKLTAGANSVAARIDAAGLVAGSQVVGLNGGYANAALSSLIGASVTLSAVSSSGLASANIQAASLLNAVAGQIGITAGTYNQLVNANVGVRSLLAAEIVVLGQQAGNAAAITGLQQILAALPGNPQVNLSRLIDIGPWQNQTVGTPPPTALAATLNAYDVVDFTLQLANGAHALAGGGVVTIPGIANLTIGTTLIEPPQTAYYGFGPAGETVHTAQLRTQISLTLLNALQVPGVGAASVTVPIYLELGDGDASISGIACANGAATTVSVLAQTALMHGYVGTAGTAAMQDFSQPVPAGQIAPANLVTAPGLQLRGSSNVVAGNSDPTTLVFAAAQAGMPQTVSSQQLTATLFQSLFTNLVVSGSVSGVPLPGTSFAPLSALLATVPLDSGIDSLAGAFGVSVGSLQVTLRGARCGRPVLVR